jgi:hypothetical protein
MHPVAEGKFCTTAVDKTVEKRSRNDGPNAPLDAQLPGSQAKKKPLDGAAS